MRSHILAFEGALAISPNSYHCTNDRCFLLIFRERAPISSRLNAIDFYLVICIFLVFTALLEYAVILLLLKKRRKPQYSINAGLKKMFNNGDAMPALPATGPIPVNARGRAHHSAAQGSASSPSSQLEEAKRMVRKFEIELSADIAASW